MLNVLEHIKEENKVIKILYNALKKDGKLIVLVPAVQFAYGSLDRDLGHVKRYSKKELEKLFLSNKIKIEESFYINFLGLIGWFINGKILRRNEFPGNQAKIFDKFILPITIMIEKIKHPPIGQSLIVIGKK